MHIALRTIAACVCVAALVSGCATDDDSESVETNEQALFELVPQIPEELTVPEGSKLALLRLADGVQIYDCKAATEGAAPAWVFRAPEADLYTLIGWPAGKHYAGPTWESTDGSTVVGARVAGASVDAASIPWLLLKASANTGAGRLAKVTYVQRLYTHGGNAPSGACAPGATVQVDYTALYAFYH